MPSTGTVSRCDAISSVSTAFGLDLRDHAGAFAAADHHCVDAEPPQLGLHVLGVAALAAMAGSMSLRPIGLTDGIAT